MNNSIKHVIISHIFLIILLFSTTIFAQDLPRIAVYVTGDIDDNGNRALSARMLTALVRSGRYTGAERPNAFIAEVETKQGELSGGVLDDDQISELGKQFGINFVCVANITSAFGEYSVSARIIDVENVTTTLAGTAHGQLRTMDDLAHIVDGVVQDMFGEPARQPQHIVAPQPKPEPEPEPASVSVTVTFTPPPLPTPVSLRTGTSMAEKAKAAAAGKMLETVMSQITPQIQRMVAAAPVSAEVKTDAEQRLTITAQNIVTTALNDGMSGKMPNPKQLLDAVMKDVTALAVELLGSVTVDIEVAGSGGETGNDAGGRGDIHPFYHGASDLGFYGVSNGFGMVANGQGTWFFRLEHLHKFGLAFTFGYDFSYYSEETDSLSPLTYEGITADWVLGLKAIYRFGHIKKHIDVGIALLNMSMLSLEEHRVHVGGFLVEEPRTEESMWDLQPATLSIAGRYNFIGTEFKRSLASRGVTQLRLSGFLGFSYTSKRTELTTTFEFIPTVGFNWDNGQYNTIWSIGMASWRIKARE